MADNANPSVDPADTESMSGLLRFVFKKLLQNTDDMLPAVVVSVTGRDYATVQPLVMVQGTDGTLTRRPKYAKVPIATAGAGNYVMSFPVTAGDLGWIQANDRDISLFLQSGDFAAPNTERLHSFEDGVFWPDKARQWALASGDSAKAVWQSLDGSIKITLGADMIELQHPTKILLTAPRVELDATTLVLHASATVTYDANGTGVVVTPSLITSYTAGVATASDAPNPPGPLA